jgi:hypothetical protein
MYVANAVELTHQPKTDERLFDWSYVIANPGIYTAQHQTHARIVHVDLPANTRDHSNNHCVFYFDGHSFEPANRQLWCKCKFKLCNEQLHVSIIPAEN